MLMNLLDENGDVSKHWELVPLANSYNVRALGHWIATPASSSEAIWLKPDAKFSGSGATSNDNIP